MATPTRSAQIAAAKRALDEFEMASTEPIGDDVDVQVINLLVALRFLCDETGIYEFELLVRISGQTFREENR